MYKIVTNDLTHDFNDRRRVINYYIQTCGSKERLTAGLFISFTPHVTCFIIRDLQFTTFFLFCTCFIVTSNNYGTRSNYLRELDVGTSLSLSRISLSLLSEK